MTRIRHCIAAMAAVAQQEGRRSRRLRAYELRCDCEWQVVLCWISQRQRTVRLQQ